jgi:hypothetical protein
MIYLEEAEKLLDTRPMVAFKIKKMSSETQKR